MKSRKYDASSIIFVITVVGISFLLHLAIAVKPRGFSMKMLRSDSKESPLHPRYANLTQRERFRGLVEQSKARARHLGSARAAAYNRSSVMNPDIARVPAGFSDLKSFYIGLVGIGTFPNQTQHFENYHLIIDSGSDLIWTQCHGGGNHFYQDPQLFDQSNSATYHRIPCENFENDCEGHCEDGFCGYNISYGSGAETSGEYAYETFTLNSNDTMDHTLESIETVIMGCGIDQRNFGTVLGVPESRHGDDQWDGPLPEPGTAPIAGILGLGQGSSNTSLVFQLHERKFEYCLDSYDLDARNGSTMYLRFGADAIIGEGPGVFSTPIIQDPNFTTPYHLNLTDISINGRSAGFEPHDFQIQDGQGGTIIDSGNPYSTMKMEPFLRVKDLVVQHFRGLGINPADPVPGRVFDPCWTLPSNFSNIPTMTLHFQGADFVIQPSGIFSFDREDNWLCFGIVGLQEEDDPKYDLNLGAMQQANKRILYDLDAMELKFIDDECGFGS